MTATAGMCQEHYYASVNTQSKYKIWVRLCMSCGHIDSADLDAQIAAASEEAARVAVANELDAVRRRYDELELQNGIDTMESGPKHKFVTWRGWKMVRNVITDRIEELTGRRDYSPTPPTQGLAEEEGK